MRRSDHHRLSWIHLAWVAWLLFNVIAFWWWEFRLSQITHWTFALYLFVIAYASMFFLQAALLFPNDIEGGYDGYGDYFIALSAPWFFASSPSPKRWTWSTSIKGTEHRASWDRNISCVTPSSWPCAWSRTRTRKFAPPSPVRRRRAGLRGDLPPASFPARVPLAGRRNPRRFAWPRPAPSSSAPHRTPGADTMAVHRHMDARAAALTAQPCPGEAALVQVMPGGVARIDQPLAAALGRSRAGGSPSPRGRRSGSRRASSASGRGRRTASDLVVGRPAAGARLLEQPALLRRETAASAGNARGACTAGIGSRRGRRPRPRGPAGRSIRSH